MARQKCSHPAWFTMEDISPRDMRLCVTDRYEQLRDHLALINPQQADGTGIWLFLGRKARTRVMRSTFGQRCTSPPNLGSVVDLYLPARRAFSDRPILVAQADLARQDACKQDTSTCHQVKVRRIDTAADAKTQPEDIFFSRFLTQYIDVVCIFCIDYDEHVVLDRLANWIGLASSVRAPWAVRPHLRLVMGQESATRREDVLARFANRCKTPLEVLFSDVSVVVLDDHSDARVHGSSTVIDASLQAKAHEIHRSRRSFRCDWPASTLSLLWTAHLDHLESHPYDPFNRVRALHPTRRYGHSASPAVSLDTCVSLFGTKSVFENELHVVAVLLFKDYVVNTSHRFNPEEVFDSLYRDECRDALALQKSRWAVSDNVTNTLLANIQQEFIFLDQNFTPSESPTAIKNVILSAWGARRRWSRLFSADVCLSCLQHRPPILLPCGHRCCQDCVRFFGIAVDPDHHKFCLPACMLCGRRTATPVITLRESFGRVLEIDGGGVKGVVPLQFLALLEDYIGVPGILKHFFDYAIGTSSGGADVLALFVLGWHPQRCLEFFTSLAQVAFQPRKVTSIPGLASLHRFVLAYLNDSLYPARGIDGALSRCFGVDLAIDDGRTSAVAHGNHVAVTAVAVPGAESCLITNYNGIGHRPEKSAYAIVRAPTHPEKLRTWESARCTTAAPWYFPVHKIAGVGLTGYDGALWSNAPIEPALQECAALEAELFHQRRGIRLAVGRPSMILSLGTGTSPPSLEVEPASWSTWLVHRLRRRTLARLLTTARHHTEGSRCWNHFLSQNSSSRQEGEIVRWEPTLPAHLMPLNKVAAMPELIALATEEFDRWTGKADLAATFVAKMFQFSLTSAYLVDHGRVAIHGKVICTWGPPVVGHEVDEHEREEFEAWCNLLRSKPLQVFVSGGRVGVITEVERGDWQCAISTELSSRGERLHVEVRDELGRPHHINQSPYQIDHLRARPTDFLPRENAFLASNLVEHGAERPRKRARTSKDD